MRRVAALLLAAALVACADTSGSTESPEHQRLRTAIEAARAAGGPGASSAVCAGCTDSNLENVLSDLDEDGSVLRYEPEGGTVWLSHPGRFWTMTFGADGGLLGLTVSAMPGPAHPPL